ncbi:aromatic-ring hydroxylase C-terminal domain-containing protein [Dictyobacter formicarum]|uniref:aromatic-ring hydroxylase C-terminal domain-containing protein n=1 Tax=Dictyobacter formicarum TaxID=2778368 RepID=UPI003570E3AB
MTLLHFILLIYAFLLSFFITDWSKTADSSAWSEPITNASNKLNIPLTVYGIGDHQAYADPEHQFQSAYGITTTGAVLVRPDGFIAWRIHILPSDPTQTLEQVLRKILCLAFE